MTETSDQSAAGAAVPDSVRSRLALALDVDDLVAAQLLNRLTQRLGQDVDALLAQLGGGPLVHVAQVGLARVELIFDAIHARRDVGSQRQIGVAARRDGTTLKRKENFDGDRDAVRLQTVAAAFDLIEQLATDSS